MIRLERFLNRRNVLFLLAPLFYLIAWNRDINLLYGMFALVTATLVVSMLLPLFALNGIDASRTLPATAFEGEEIEVKVSLVNEGWTSRFMVEAIDCLPAAAPLEREPLVFAGRIAGHTRRDFDYRLSCYKRGLYAVGPLRLRSAYPLGIAWAEREAAGSLPSLVVYPAMFDVGSFPLMAAGTFTTCGMEAMDRAGGSDDFFGTREYRQGDSLRHIHWPSTARLGQLIVKEYEVRASTEMTMLLDLHREADIGEERESTLEYAVRIAASLARYALERGHTVQCAGFGTADCLVPPGKGVHHLPQVLDALARVAADGRLPYHEAIAQSAGLLRDGSTAVLFLAGTRSLEDYLYPFGLLQAKRVRMVGIWLDAAGFAGKGTVGQPDRDPLVQELVGRGATVYVVRKGDDLREVFP